MDQWLDSLSEDWISQPRSPHSDALRRSSSIRSAGSPSPSNSQSRIPRYKPQTSSNLGSSTATSSRRVSTLPNDAGRNAVLKERTQSNLNSARPLRHNVSKRLNKLEDLATKHDVQLGPTGSLPSVAQGTVQQKVSPVKKSGSGDTPEWRRRVLQGKAGGTQPDLFGPIGLESIFKPPTISPGTDLRKKDLKRHKPANAEDFPSSPPPYPSGLAPEECYVETEGQRSSLVYPLEAVDEESGKEEQDKLLNEAKSTKGDDRVGQEESQRLSAIIDDRDEKLSRIGLSRLRVVDIDRSPQVCNPFSEPFNDRVMESTSEQPVLRPGNDPPKKTEAVTPPQASATDLLMSDWTSHSLPEDLSTGTDAYAANGGFVNMRRGGYSNDGSFHQRQLSPSSLPDFDASELRSPSPRKTQSHRAQDVPRSAPVTPKRRAEVPLNSDKSRSSGSPLKLFDKHDTFTNERLIRRMSTFEQSLHNKEDKELRSTSDCNSFSLETQYQPQPELKVNSPKSRRISSFGEGDLDSHTFETNHPYTSSRDVNLVRLPGDAKSSTIKFHKVAESSYKKNDDYMQQDVKQTVHGKRLPYSPAKESQAKRQRTLQSLEWNVHKVDQDTRLAKPNSQSNATMISKKRKDALYDTNVPIADPKVLAMRQKLRPRTPTQSQKSLRLTQAQQLKKDVAVNGTFGSSAADLEHQTQALAGELVNFTLNIAQDMTQGPRKASVTTADFFNEAKQIMQLIRLQGRPQSSNSIPEEEEEEEEEEPQSVDVQGSQVEQSTLEGFSRPPSREGGGNRPAREPMELDARVVSHLRRFEDTDDLGLALPSSAKSMHVSELHKEQPASVMMQDAGKGDHQSDMSNVRILDHMIREQKHRLSNNMEEPTIAIATHTQSHDSQSTSVPSTERSIPTGSSRGSRSSATRAVIAPAVVSHLISDHVAGMTFDHTRQAWVKRKSSRISSRSGSHSRTGSELTEDLLRDIPDLSVDELEERERVRTSHDLEACQQPPLAKMSEHDGLVLSEPDDADYPRPVVTEQAPSGCQTGENIGLSTGNETLARSRHSKSTIKSNRPISEQKAISWDDEAIALRAKDELLRTSTSPSAPKVLEHAEDVEHEISIFEGRASQTPSRSSRKKHQARVVTVAFSSPLVDQIRTLRIDDGGGEEWDEDSDLDLSESPAPSVSRPGSARTRRLSFGGRHRSGYRSASRRASIGNQSYVARPMSRLDENEELSLVHGSSSRRATRKKGVILTPLPASRNSLVAPSSVAAQKSHLSFQLSHLSEFTVHQSDDLVNRDLSHVARRRGLLSMHEVEGKLSLSVQDLVKKLTDLEPYEPYWDYIRRVNLQNRNLLTLHTLDDFCGSIEDLDVSGNELGQLNGCPRTVRNLKVRQNCLSNLTSWSHLQNLQYLDVSGNQIQSLSGFYGLIHLRELKADDNQIESLDGILELDGLLRLRLRNNRVKALDFEACNL